MRVGLLTYTTARETSTPTAYINPTFSTLQSLGIRFIRHAHNSGAGSETPTPAQLSADYDALVIIALTNSYTSLLDHADLTIPCFIINVSSLSAGIGAQSGITEASRVAQASVYVESIFSSVSHQAAYGYSYPPVSGDNGFTPLMWVKTGETNAGNVLMWRTKQPTNNAWRYYSSLQESAMFSLPLLIQTAINDGALSTAISKSLLKFPSFFDIDHVNNRSDFDSTSTGNETFLDRFTNAIRPGGTSIAGIYNGTTGRTEIQNMGTALRDRLLTAQNSGKLRYSWHTHITTGGDDRLQPTSGTFPIVAHGGSLQVSPAIVTKQQQYDGYQLDKTDWEAQSLALYPGYYNPGANSWDEDTISLYQRDTNKASDPSNAVSTAGLGFYYFRTITGASTRKDTRTRQERYSTWHVKRHFSGIFFAAAVDIGWQSGFSANGPHNTADKWRQVLGNIMGAMVGGGSVWLHSVDLIDNQGIGDGEYSGVEILTLYNDFMNYMKDVAVSWAKPEQYCIQRLPININTNVV